MNHSVFEVERHPDGEVVLHFRPILRGFPPTTSQHFLTAQREFLLGLRSMLDVAIEGTEQRQRRTVSKTKTKIDVQ